MVRRILTKLFGIKALEDYKQKVVLRPKYLKIKDPQK